MKRRVPKRLILMACLVSILWTEVAPVHAHSDLVFIPNRGQWKQPFDYKASSEGMSLFLTSGKATVVMTPPAGHPRPEMPAPGTPRGFAFEIAFRNAAMGIKPSAEARIDHPVNFIKPEGSYSARPSSSFQYRNCLPGGSSMTWRDDGGHATFDFTIPAGADLSDIAKIGFEIIGTEITLNPKGDLILASPYGPVTMTAPKSFQIINGKRRTVSSRFVMQGKGKVGFRLGREYDPDYTLTIDPSLIFSTYSGSRADNWGNSATYGPNGTVFSGGIVFDRGFPATIGVLDTSFHTIVDIGILKYSSDGKSLLWATYLGGSNTEVGHSLVADDEGHLYILATTSSSDFPTTAGTFDRTFNGGPAIDPMGYSFYHDFWYPAGSDYAIVCLDTNGARLKSSTFLGGTGNDGLLFEPDGINLTRNYGDQFKGEIILDNQGRVCIAGTTFSADFPVRNGLGRTYQAVGDAMMARLSSDLTTLQSASFYGGMGRESAYGIAIDSIGNTYITGGTQSTGLAGAVGTGYSGNTDGYLLALSPAWTSIQRVRYLGTSEYDQSFLVQTDRAGNVYAIGQTAGSWPISPGTYNNARGGQFLTSFTSGLAAPRFSTRFGGNAGVPDIALTAFLVDNCGKIYISGWGGEENQGDNYIGGSTFNLPVTPNAYQNHTDGSDFYLMVLTRDAAGLEYGTFMGGTGHPAEHVDGGTSRFDKKGVVYQAVCACGGSSFPTTPGIWSPQNQAGNCNNAVFKFDFSLLKARFLTDTLAGCVPFTAQFRNLSEFGQSYKWTFGSDTSSRSDSVFSYTFQRPGSFDVTLRAINPDVCQVVDSVSRTFTAYAANIAPDTSLTFCHTGDTLQLNNLELPGYRYQWQHVRDSLLAQPRVVPFESTLYPCEVTSPQGCKASRTVRVIDHRHTVELILSIAIPGCVPYPMVPHITGVGGNDSLVWDYGDGYVYRGFHPSIHTYDSAGVYTVTVTAYSDSVCDKVVRDTAILGVGDLRAYPDSVYRYCTPSDTLQLANISNPGYHFQWQPSFGLSSDTVANPLFFPRVSGAMEYSVSITTPYGCLGTRHVKVNNGIMSLFFRSTFAANLCLGTPKPTIIAVNSEQPWDSLRWTINGQSFPDSSIVPGDALHFLSGHRMDTAGRYSIKVEVSSSQTCIPNAADSMTIGIGRTAIPSDTTLQLCPQDQFRLFPPVPGAMQLVQWLPYNQVEPYLDGVFSAPINITAVVIDTFGCQQRRGYTLEQQQLSAQAMVTPVYNPCEDSYIITFDANPITPGSDAGWVWRDRTLNPHAQQPSQGGTLADTAYLRLSLRGCQEELPFLVQARNQPITLEAAFQSTMAYNHCTQYPEIDLHYDSAASPCTGCQFEWALPNDQQAGRAIRFQPQQDANPVTLTVSSGPCQQEFTKILQVKKMSAPNVVTPNGDNRNDAFNLPTDGQTFGIQVFNRNGRSVYKGPGENWPSGNTMAGTYFYSVEGMPENRTCTGWVEVVK